MQQWQRRRENAGNDLQSIYESLRQGGRNWAPIEQLPVIKKARCPCDVNHRRPVVSRYVRLYLSVSVCVCLTTGHVIHATKLRRPWCDDWLEIGYWSIRHCSHCAAETYFVNRTDVRPAGRPSVRLGLLYDIIVNLRSSTVFYLRHRHREQQQQQQHKSQRRTVADCCSIVERFYGAQWPSITATMFVQ